MPDLTAIDAFSPYTWFIYKSGSNYKAKNGPLGYVPTGAISTSMNTVWTYVRDNFNLAGEDANYTGLIRLGRGEFTLTDEWLIDNTIQSSSNRGIVLQGMKNSTWITFAPTTPITAGFHIKSVAGTILRDINVQWNDNTTSAIWLDASAASTSFGLIDSVRLFKTGTIRQSGSIGIKIQQQNDSNFALHGTTVRNCYIKEAETGIDIHSLGNASFMNFDDIILWTNLRGINAANDTSVFLNSFDNIRIQAHSTAIEYGISCAGKFNTFSNIIGDVIDQAGTAVIILQPGAFYNKITNPIDSSGSTILDYSGNITNEYTNYTAIAGYPNLKGRERLGRWNGMTSTGGSGLMDGILQQVTAGVGNTITPTLDTTQGWSVTFTPNGASTHCGIQGNLGIIARRLQPIFYCRFKHSTVGSNTRMFIGLTSDFVAHVYADLGDTYQTATSCIGVMIPSGIGQNWKVFSGDGTGDAVITDYLDANSALITADANMHELWIHGDEANSRWLISLDGDGVNILSTAANIPAEDTALTPFAIIQFIAVSNKTMTLYDMSVRCRQ